jgi:hypothetical protein
LYSFHADDVAHTATNRSAREKTENFNMHENTPTVAIATKGNVAFQQKASRN